VAVTGPYAITACIGKVTNALSAPVHVTVALEDAQLIPYQRLLAGL
jgi:hypothetical protein